MFYPELNRRENFYYFGPGPIAKRRAVLFIMIQLYVILNGNYPLRIIKLSF